MSILDTTVQVSGCQLSNGSLFHWKWPACVRLWHVVFCWTCVHYGKRPSCLCQRNIFLPTWSDVALRSIQIWRPWHIPEYMSGTRRCFQCQVIVPCSRFCCAEILGETTPFGLSLAMRFWIKYIIYKLQTLWFLKVFQCSLILRFQSVMCLYVLLMCFHSWYLSCSNVCACLSLP